MLLSFQSFVFNLDYKRGARFIQVSGPSCSTPAGHWLNNGSFELLNCYDVEDHFESVSVHRLLVRGGWVVELVGVVVSETDRRRRRGAFVFVCLLPSARG